MLIAIGTKNKAKVGAVEKIATQLIHNAQFVAIDVSSNVSEQPFSNEETRQGAINRAQAALQQTDAQIGFGLEGGVYELADTMYCCNWGALATREGNVYACAGATFTLPSQIAERLRNGEELGPVMDDFTKTTNIRHHAGAIGIFTNGHIDRKEMFEHIVLMLIGQYEYEQQATLSKQIDNK